MSASSEHLAAVNETYLEHQRHACTYGWRLIRAGLACLVHAVLPSRCVTTGSDEVIALAAEMSARRQGVPQGMSHAVHQGVPR